MGHMDRIVTSALIAGGVLLAVLVIWLQWFWAGTSMDVHVYWEAGARMWAGGSGLYDESEDPANRVGLYIYPPFFAGLFAPLTLLPRWLGYAVWGLIQLALVAAALRGARGLCDVPPGAKARAFYAALLAAVYGALWINLQEGQVNMLLLAMIVVGLWQLERGRSVTGGLLLACAVHLKVIPIVLLPLLIAQKRFKAAAIMAGGVALLWLLPLLYTVPNHGVVDGWAANNRLWGEYAERIVTPRVEVQSADDLGGARAPNNSISAVVHRWFSEGSRLSLKRKDRSPIWTTLPETPVKYSGLAIGALLGAMAMLLAWRTRESRLGRTAAIGLGLLAAALANLLFWTHHLCLLLLVIAPLAARALDNARDRKWLYAALMTVLVLCYAPLINTVAPLDWLAVVGAPTLGVLIVWAITFARFWNSPPEPVPVFHAVAQGAGAHILRGHDEATPTGNPAA